jgi:putative phosphoesterase
MLRIGLVSDTHGLLRSEVVTFLQGCDQIIHAGDIGSSEIIDRLKRIAPVIAVRGNNDRGHWAENLHDTEFVQIAEHYFYVIDDSAELDIVPEAAGVKVIVSGHSHIPRIEESRGVVYINPGSCGPKRFKLPISVGEVFISGDNVKARLVNILE